MMANTRASLALHWKKQYKTDTGKQKGAFALPNGDISKLKEFQRSTTEMHTVECAVCNILETVQY